MLKSTCFFGLLKNMLTNCTAFNILSSYCGTFLVPFFLDKNIQSFCFNYGAWSTFWRSVCRGWNLHNLHCRRHWILYQGPLRVRTPLPRPLFLFFFCTPGQQVLWKAFFFLPPRHVIGYSNRFFISFPIVRALILAIVHYCLCGIPISSRNPVAPDPWALTLENDHRIAKVTATHA